MAYDQTQFQVRSVSTRP